MQDLAAIRPRFDAVVRNVEEARRERAAKGLADPPVTVLAVTKAFGPDMARAAYASGLVDFGESRAQELRDKAPLLPEDVRWHFIGRLQKNKVKYVVGRACLVHSVDDVGLLRAVASRADHLGTVQAILIQVHLSGEAQKGGAPASELVRLAEAAVELGGVRLEGLMTMAAHDPDPEQSRTTFRKLRECADALRQRDLLPEVASTVLSMGMSGDYPVAVEEGATVVRVGTAIFGNRPRHPTTK